MGSLEVEPLILISWNSLPPINVLYTDFHKVNHQILITKLLAFDFSSDAVTLLGNYFQLSR